MLLNFHQNAIMVIVGKKWPFHALCDYNHKTFHLNTEYDDIDNNVTADLASGNSHSHSNIKNSLFCLYHRPPPPSPSEALLTMVSHNKVLLKGTIVSQ